MSRAMKDSGVAWIGEIPESWQCRPIKNGFSVYSGATPKSDVPEFWDGTIVWVTPADFKTQDRTVSSGKRNLTEAGYASCGTTLVPAGSIIFSKRAPIGTVSVANAALCTNQGCLSCVPHEGIDTWYFYYAMSVFTEQFNLYGTGTTFKEISYNDYVNFLLPLPSSFEQARISTFLDRRCAEIDRIMEQTRATIEEYKKLKQSIITEAVTHGVRGERKMKDSGVEWIGEIPEEWRITRIRFVGQVKTGPFGTQLSADEYADEGVPIINVKNIGSGYIRIEDLDRIPDSVAERLKEHKLRQNDIVFGRKGSIDKHAIISSESSGWVQGSDCIRLRLIADVLPLFLNYYLESTIIKDYLRTASNGATMASLNSEMIENIYIVLPDDSEQSCIVKHLNVKCAEIDRLIDSKLQLLAQLETYKKAVIYEVVTGKREVPNR